MQVGGGDEQTVKSNERRVTALLRDSGYISKRARWGGSGPSNRWFRAVCRGVPTFPIVTVKNSGVVDSPPTAINNNSSIDGYNGDMPAQSAHPAQELETEHLLGFDAAMAEMICPQ